MTARPSLPRRAGLAVFVLIALAALIWWQARDAPPSDDGLIEQPAAPGASAPARAAPPAAVADAPAASADLARYDLAADEARGGHTIARHVGKTDADLLDRLRRERGISAASTYTDRATAERIVAETIAQNRTKVDVWKGRQGNRPNLALDYRGPTGESIGRSIARGSTRAVACTDAVVVLRWDRARSFIVLTSYPEARR